MRSRQRLDRLHEHPDFAAAAAIVARLQRLGHSAVFAGGCVRDSLLGRTPKDLDIATSALPDEIERAFNRTLSVGKAFGTIKVLADGSGFEVTTFRKDAEYLDGRRPSAVHFTDIEEDARRRDFTVNALFYDPANQTVIDFVAGLKDLRACCLRTVGRPEERFREDHLRMLRGVRFVAQLGFALHPDTAAAMLVLHKSLAAVSAERISAEVQRLLESPFFVNGLKELKAARLHQAFWPEFESFDMNRLAGFPAFTCWENAFAAIMFDVAPELITERLARWKVSRESQRRIHEQIKAARALLAPGVRRAQRLRVLGGEYFADVLVLVAGRGCDPGQLQSWLADYLEIAGPDGCLPAPFLTGQDLIAAGHAPGARLGELLKTAYDAQLEGEIRSKEEALERIARN